MKLEALIPPCKSSSHIYPILQALQGKHELSVTMTWPSLQVLVMEVGSTNQNTYQHPLGTLDHLIVSQPPLLINPWARTHFHKFDTLTTPMTHFSCSYEAPTAPISLLTCNYDQNFLVMCMQWQDLCHFFRYSLQATPYKCLKLSRMQSMMITSLNHQYSSNILTKIWLIHEGQFVK